jgi:hypothetical protein
MHRQGESNVGKIRIAQIDRRILVTVAVDVDDDIKVIDFTRWSGPNQIGQVARQTDIAVMDIDI